MNFLLNIPVIKIWILPVIDIVLVWFIVYQIYKLLAGTRAIQVITGLAIVLLSFAISKLLFLETLNWLINYIITYGVIVLIVIFQPEIRRVLGRIGQNTAFYNLIKHRQDASISELCNSIETLSRKKTGALIIIRRYDYLKLIIETGVKLDAEINAGLINSIFQKKSPLHDGAVVIENNRIIAANCFLPLSDNKSISRNFGTRHRAALGLAEESDAFIIVVSEETGKISIAQNDKLKTDIKINQIKNEIIKAVSI